MNRCVHHSLCLLYKLLEEVLWSGVALVGQVWAQQHYASIKWSQRSTWMCWMSRLCHQWIFFLPWRHRHIPGRQCWDSSGSKCERLVQGARGILTVTPLTVFGMRWRRLYRAVRLSRPQDLGQKLMQCCDKCVLWSKLEVVQRNFSMCDNFSFLARQCMWNVGMFSFQEENILNLWSFPLCRAWGVIKHSHCKHTDRHSRVLNSIIHQHLQSSASTASATDRCCADFGKLIRCLNAPSGKSSVENRA